jgi:hypothetical protein
MYTAVYSLLLLQLFAVLQLFHTWSCLLSYSRFSPEAVCCPTAVSHLQLFAVLQLFLTCSC